MAILQALLTFISRSTGRILNAIFGWAVRALFGYTSGTRQALLTGVVAAAALWPLLLVGLAWPRVSALALAFVPIPEGVPDSAIRLGWLALALLVPVVVGVALALNAPPHAPREPIAMRLVRGFPITLGIAIAFWLSFVSVPFFRIASAVRGHRDEHVPLVTDSEGYAQAAARIQSLLNARGFGLVAKTPGFWVRAPQRALRALGGAAMRGYVPERLAHFRGGEVEVALHPNGVLLRGPERRIVLAQGLLAEGLTPTDAFQTTGAQAQEIERQIRQVWQVLDAEPEAHVGSRWLISRVNDIADEIVELETAFDDWQIVYRQTLQLARAVGGEPQLLAKSEPGNGDASARAATRASGGWSMEAEYRATIPVEDARSATTADLLREVGAKLTQLTRKEIELARAELRSDFQSQLAMVKGMAVAAVAGIAALNLLLVAAVFAALPEIEGWVSALGLAGACVALAGGVGLWAWRKRLTRPLARTRKTLVDDVRWAKERLA